MTLRVTDGLEVPLHRSLVEPMMVVGLPRTVALVLWTTVCAIGLVFHLVCVAAAKSDPYIFEILAVALKAQRRLDP
jgi:type IV secretion system protein VirB3